MDLRGVAGYHQVNNNEARDLIQPHLGQDGYYLLRPSNQNGIVCTICVVNQKKTVNYRLSQDQHTGQYFIHNHALFTSVEELIDYYSNNPINAEAMTMLLYPIMGEENYVVMEKDDADNIPKEASRQPSVKQQKAGNGEQKPAKGEQKASKGEQKAGKGEQKAGKEEQKAGKGEQKAGKEEQKAGKEEQKAGKEEQKAGKEEQKAGKGEQKEQKMAKGEQMAGNVEKTKGGKKAGKVEQYPRSADPGVGGGGGGGDDSNTPGLHKHLPKSHLSLVMEPYLSTDGNYLIRPSSTSEGQLTLTVSHLGKASNFKINYEEGQYYINPKKRFDTVTQLLEYYHNSPIKSKQKDADVYLLFPIPVNEELEAGFEREVEAKKVTKLDVVQEPLPEPWQQFYSEEHRRPYYHNPHTNVTLWERPRVSTAEERKCATLPTRRTTRGRALPELPPTSSDPSPSDAAPSIPSGRRPSKEVAANGHEQTVTPKLERQRTLSKEDSRPMAPLPSARDSRTSSFPKDDPLDARPLPSLPAKEEMSIKPLPSLPAKEDTARPLPLLPAKEDTARPLPSLPAKEDTARPLPSLPARGDTGVRSIPPSLPAKEDSRAKTFSTSLPAREETGGKSLPRLPPKEEGSPVTRHQSLKGTQPQQQEDEGRLLKKSDRSLKLPDRQSVASAVAPSPPPGRKSPSSPPVLPAAEPLPPSSPGLSFRGAPTAPPPSTPATPTSAGPPPPPPPPPLPVMVTLSPTLGSAPPPPPPPPPLGLAPPPPLLPPPLSPNLNASRPKAPASSPDPSAGRPFNAGDLAAGKERLKKKENTPDVKKSLSSSFGKGGMADIFSNAIDSRRKAMADSDSETSEFEDIDEEWDDGD